MSGLCSGAALHSTAFEALADALRDQFQCSLPIEVHVLDAARRAMFVPLCRSEYDKAPRVLAEGSTNKVNTELHRSANITAAGKQTHAWDGKADSHEKTCHKPPAGNHGCRMGAPFAHWVRLTRALIVRTVQTSEPGKQYLIKRAEHLVSEEKISMATAMSKVKLEMLPKEEMDKIYQSATVLPFEDLTCGNP